jgi:hypothetical protein
MSMKSIKQTLARKAVKSTAKHTAHGTTSKLKRDPLRATTLLAVGCAVGVAAGRLMWHSTEVEHAEAG